MTKCIVCKQEAKGKTCGREECRKRFADYVYSTPLPRSMTSPWGQKDRIDEKNDVDDHRLPERRKKDR